MSAAPISVGQIFGHLGADDLDALGELPAARSSCSAGACAAEPGQAARSAGAAGAEPAVVAA